MLVVLIACGCGGDDPDTSTAPGSASARTGVAWPKTGLRPTDAAWPPFVILGRRERPSQITWRIDPAASPVDATAFHQAVTAAFATWQRTGVVAFEEVALPREADVVLSWHGADAKGCRFIKWDGGIAHAGRVGFAGAVIHFNSEVDWAAHSIQGTALHEIGHILGIGHSPRADALMYGGYDDDRFTLRRPDLDALHTLYGGGRDTDADLHVVEFDPNGAPRFTATLKGVAPPAAGIVMELVDTKGDGTDELLLWRRPGAHGPLMMFEWMHGPVVAQTRGPLKGFTRPDRDTWIAHDSADVATVVHVRADNRYVALTFDDKGLPSKPRPPGPLDLGNGLRDEDGDGVLDGRPPPGAQATGPQGTLGQADVDADGYLDWLVRGTKGKVRWLLTGGSERGRHPGPEFLARHVVVGRLDDDSRPDAVLLRR